MNYKNSLTMAPHFGLISHMKQSKSVFSHQQMLFNTHLCPNILLSRYISESCKVKNSPEGHKSS